MGKGEWSFGAASLAQNTHRIQHWQPQRDLSGCMQVCHPDSSQLLLKITQRICVHYLL